ncbi:SHOCT domain-containing protein [Thermopirellula anaerolimosa]
MHSIAILGRLFFWSAVALGMIGIAIWLVRRIRGDALARRDSQDQAERMLREFASMKADGRLNDSEYRAIRDRLRSAEGTPTTFRSGPGKK